MQILFDNWDLVLLQDQNLDEMSLYNNVKKYNKESRRPSNEWNSLPNVLFYFNLIKGTEFYIFGREE
jgi:hypothetical protein